MTKSTFNLFRGLLFGLILALLQAGFATASTLQPNADGTVTDPNTGLVWMRCAMGQTWTGSTCNGTPNNYTFDQANALTGRVTFAGQNDWRVPNIRELLTIVDRSVYGSAIDSTAFPNTPTVYFWSSSPLAYYLSNAWSVYFNNGFNNGSAYYYDGRSGNLAVRLVRGGQSFGSLLSLTRPTSDYVDNGNGTVTHAPTSLTRMRCVQGQTWTGSTCSGTASKYSFDQANALTGATAFAGKSDWRLPTADELLSLVDYRTRSPAVNTSIFPAQYAGFWSTSPAMHGHNNISYAWFVGFSDGYVSSAPRTDGYAVRLVRGGPNAGKAYRLYQAAFDRAPDQGGLAYWIRTMDAGMDLLEVAARFVDSAEFKSMYGTNPTNAYFLIKLYDHVLHRAPEQAGYDWWLNELNSGRYSQTKALASFAESDENKANVCRNGCPY